MIYRFIIHLECLKVNINTIIGICPKLLGNKKPSAIISSKELTSKKGGLTDACYNYNQR